MELNSIRFYYKNNQNQYQILFISSFETIQKLQTITGTYQNMQNNQNSKNHLFESDSSVYSSNIPFIITDYSYLNSLQSYQTMVSNNIQASSNSAFIAFNQSQIPQNQNDIYLTKTNHSELKFVQFSIQQVCHKKITHKCLFIEQNHQKFVANLCPCSQTQEICSFFKCSQSCWRQKEMKKRQQTQIPLEIVLEQNEQALKKPKIEYSVDHQFQQENKKLKKRKKNKNKITCLCKNNKCSQRYCNCFKNGKKCSWQCQCSDQCENHQEKNENLNENSQNGPFVQQISGSFLNEAIFVSVDFQQYIKNQ